MLSAVLLGSASARSNEVGPKERVGVQRAGSAHFHSASFVEEQETYTLIPLGNVLSARSTAKCPRLKNLSLMLQGKLFDC